MATIPTAADCKKKVEAALQQKQAHYDKTIKPLLHNAIDEHYSKVITNDINKNNGFPYVLYSVDISRHHKLDNPSTLCHEILLFVRKFGHKQFTHSRTIRHNSDRYSCVLVSSDIHRWGTDEHYSKRPDTLSSPVP
jgi:hypothetical protein